jgi:hypothetical protein
MGAHENWVLGTVFGVDSKRIVSVGRDRAAKLTDAGSGAFLENENLLRGELAAIARHPSKEIVVIGGDERIPYIYMMDRPKNMKIADDTTLIRKLERQNGAITALAWSADGGSGSRLGARRRRSMCTTRKAARAWRSAGGTWRESTPWRSVRTAPCWRPADLTARCASMTPPAAS